MSKRLSTSLTLSFPQNPVDYIANYELGLPSNFFPNSLSNLNTGSVLMSLLSKPKLKTVRMVV